MSDNKYPCIKWTLSVEFSSSFVFYAKRADLHIESLHYDEDDLTFLLVMTSSEPTEELVPPGTLISTTAPEQTSLIQEIEFFQPVTISNVDLETTNVSVGTGNTNSSNSIVFGEEEASESTRSIGTAVAATGFIVVFIVVFLMVAIGITFNVCRYDSFLNDWNLRNREYCFSLKSK